MVIENTTIINQVKDSINPGEIIKALPPEIISKIDFLINFGKIIGILFLIYIVFLIIKAIFNLIRDRRIKKIYQKVIEIDEKLDLLLKNKKFQKNKNKN